MPQTTTAQLMISRARSLAYSEQYSLTEGWNDNTLVSILNLGLNRFYNAITQIENDAYVEEARLDSVANQDAYDLPIEVSLALRLVDVRFLYGNEIYQFIELSNSPVQDRYAYPANLPQIYTIRKGQILLSPMPTATRTGNIVINYQKRMRGLDIRRGIISNYDDSGPGPITFDVDYTATSQKDANLRVNGESVLDLTDYICIVDYKGTPIVSEIPVASYDQVTQVITTEPDFAFIPAQQAALDALIADGQSPYIVTGQYSSTNSELDAWCEAALVEYMVLRLLRLQSDAAETAEQFATEQAVINQLITQHRRIRPTTYKVEMIGGRSSNYYPYVPGRYT